MKVEMILKEFGEAAQKEDIEFEELEREFKERYNIDIETVAVELQNAFVYDYIIVRVKDNSMYKINFCEDGFVTSVAKL